MIKCYFLKTFLKELGKNFKPCVKVLNVPKIELFSHNYYGGKIITRVLVGFDKTTENRGHGRRRDFSNVCHAKAPGTIIIIIKYHTFL